MGIADRTRAESSPSTGELHIRAPGVYVCLAVNRRHRVARVVDFMAGNFVQKMRAIDAAALKAGIERVYTLVEREESHGWMKVGYAREGSIPAYYKRADAYLLGHLVSAAPALDDEGIPLAPVADVARAEKTLVQARKLAPTLTVPRALKSEVLTDDEAAARWTRRPAWLDDRFGRASMRFHLAVRPARGTKTAEQVLSIEAQETFGNAVVQPATWPTKADEAPLLAAALERLTAELEARALGCCFGVSPADNVPAATAMLAAGYRKTGVLAKHLGAGDRRVDAILWSHRENQSLPAETGNC